VLTLTLSGRFNGTEVSLRDQLGTALDGDHDFDRFNPAVGLTANFSDALTLYAGYSESNRAPSPVELTCANPGDPCRLPNAFLADPPLEQVVARTLEAGLRGLSQSLEWHAGVFRTTSDDDILFISAGALSNQGYFDNLGRTRREGIEINLRGEAGRSSWFFNYSFLRATFREHLKLPSPNSPAALAGEITVRPGDKLPLLPQHLLQAGVEIRVNERLRVAASLGANSSFHLRGDEANDIGEIGRQAVVGLRGDYRFSEQLTVWLAVDNVFDSEYETFGLFGEPEEVLGEGFEDSRFVSPGAPRAAWVGLRLEL
jgi:outer membrane receptor protein involved in Fe transport